MRKFRHMAEYALLRAALFVFAVMPPEGASNLGGAIFRTIGPRMGISRTARRNLRNCFPDWDDAQIEKTVTGMWDNLGRIVAEYPHIEEIAKNRTDFHPCPRATQAANEKQSILFATGHYGNWEVLPGSALYHLGVHVHVAYRAPNNPYVDRLIVRLRGLGGKLKSFGKTRRGLADIMMALKGGETVGMLVDQKMNTGIEAPFFGQPAMTSTAFVELPQKLGCPLIPARSVRKGPARFDVFLEDEIPVKDADGIPRATEDVVADMHNVLERWIREYPDHWLWLHRRWKG